MDELLKQLQDKRQQLAAGMKTHADKQATWNAEDRQKWDQLNKDYDENLKALNERRAKVEAEDAERKAIADRLTAVDTYQPYQPPARNHLIGRDGASLDAGPANAALFGNRAQVSDQALALHAWMLAGSSELRNQITDEHREAAARLRVNFADNSFTLRLLNTTDFRALQRTHPYSAGHREGVYHNSMSVGVPSSGGHTVGVTLMTTLERAMLDFSGVLQVAEIIRTTTGEPIEFITADDTGNTGSRVGENADAGTASDPTVGKARLTSFDFTTGLLYVSRSLLRDSVINLEEQLGQMLGERLGRKQNTDYTTGGGGGNSPQGIVTGSTVGVTAASATATTWDEIIDLEHSIDPSRRGLPGVGYMMHDSILKAYRKLKDGNGQPIWQVGWNAGVPDMLNKRPYWINQAMASAMATGAKTLLFGQLRMMKVRQVGSITIQRLVERRAEFNQDVFIAYAHGDSVVVDPGDHPIKHLAQA